MSHNGIIELDLLFKAKRQSLHIWEGYGKNAFA